MASKPWFQNLWNFVEFVARHFGHPVRGGQSLLLKRAKCNSHQLLQVMRIHFRNESRRQKKKLILVSLYGVSKRSLFLSWAPGSICIVSSTIPFLSAAATFLLSEEISLYSKYFSYYLTTFSIVISIYRVSNPWNLLDYRWYLWQPFLLNLRNAGAKTNMFPSTQRFPARHCLPKIFLFTFYRINLFSCHRPEPRFSSASISPPGKPRRLDKVLLHVLQTFLAKIFLFTKNGARIAIKKVINHLSVNVGPLIRIYYERRLTLLLALVSHVLLLHSSTFHLMWYTADEFSNY